MDYRSNKPKKTKFMEKCFSEMRKPLSGLTTRSRPTRVSLPEEEPANKSADYKKLDVYVINSGMSIQKVGKRKSHKRKLSEVDLRGVQFPDDIDESFHHGLIDESFSCNFDQQVPDGLDVLLEEPCSFISSMVNGGHFESAKPVMPKSGKLCNQLGGISVPRLSSGNPVSSTSELLSAKSTMQSNIEEDSEDHMVPSLSKDAYPLFKEVQKSKQRTNHAVSSRVNVLLQSPSPFFPTFSRGGCNNTPMQLVPETPLLSNTKSPCISGQIHRRNSGFQVPETPILRTGVAFEMKNATPIVKETPLLPGIRR